MINDYSDRCFLTTRTKQHQMRRKVLKKKFLHLSVSRAMLKTTGAMVILSLLIGIVTTVWFGQQLKTSLDAIGKNSTVRDDFLARKEKLTDQRDLLISRVRIEAAAKKLGLFPPTENQIHKP